MFVLKYAMNNIILPPNLLLGSEIDPRWASGPFLDIKLMPAKAKGKRFEQIATFILQNLYEC
jgi:hypothetical protein